MRAFLVSLAVLLHFRLSLQQQCSASQPCPLGCCSQWGSCGFGPDFCGEGCLSGCDRKSDCNPGWDSDEWSNAETCPLNVCCSEYGFCGTTEQFCDEDDAVDRPSCNISGTPVRRVIGYYEAWSMTERPCYGMIPEDIPFGYYTHINFAFATINPQTFEIIPGDSQTESLMNRIGALKLFQPDLEIWVAVGGWAFNDPGPTATTFSDLAASTEAQDAFIDSLIRMMNTFGLDGVNIDWEYPVAPDRSGRREDFDNFVTFLDRLRQRLGHEGLRKGISLTLPSSYWYLQHFDIQNLERSVDWFNIMSYDIHGSWDIDNPFTGPFVNSHTNFTEIQMALDLLWRNDINPDKVVLGMSFYSRSFTLADPGCSEPQCLVTSGGTAGECSRTTGVLLHPEIQDIISERNLRPTLYREEAVKAVAWDDQWVSFDDQVTWRLKSNLARSQCISGVMVWAISQDDAKGTNIRQLTAAVGREVMDYPEFVERSPPAVPVQVDLPQLCTWAACGQECPSGFKLIMRDGTDEIFGDHIRCSGGGQVKLCCPANQRLPTCTWRGHRNTGRCRPGCESGEVEIGSLRLGCRSGYQSACCTAEISTAPWGNCRWHSDNCSPGEDAPCSDEYPHFIYSAAWGQGGMPPCGWLDARQSYCCMEPPPADFARCGWITDNEDRTGQFCDACRDDQVHLGSRSTDRCLTPSEAFCCDRPTMEITPREPPEEEDPFGGAQAEEFRLLIEKYMRNPTCPAAILEPNLHDIFTSPMPGKRSLQFEAQEFDILRRQEGRDCTLRDWILLLQFATTMLRNRSPSLNPLRAVWDDEFAGGLDDQYTSESLMGFFDLYPEYDSNSWLEYVLYNPYAAGTGMRIARGASEILCELPGSTAVKTRRDELARSGRNSTSRPVSRAIWAFGGGTNDVPSLLTLFEGIEEGDLSLHYARWQWQTGRSTGQSENPFLELAYWIGWEPGVADPNPLFDRYRDTSPRQGPPDRWVIFHLHVNAEGFNTNWLRNFADTGRTHMGVDAVSVYHGQIVHNFNNGDAWRVDNSDHDRRNSENLNRRDGFNCPQDVGSLWYVGRPVDIPAGTEEEEVPWYLAFERWGQRLFNAGIARTPGISVILPNAPRLPNGDINPPLAGPVLRRYEQSSVVGNGDPYTVNWVVGGNDQVTTFVDPPPPN
ncbi:hypothetical protein DL771_003117 [Monosporascus sp. 5C6A]|nr:hypothetical protein DL771_003117 [Monosporascus sp. 5C6A]